MNYELAKELKDSGFPLTHCQNGMCHQKDYYPESLEHQPTLSELIEACGDKFKRLVHDLEEIGFAGVTWIACSPGDDHIEGHGKTPEEAVAKLWLALNKHGNTKTN